MKLNEKLDSWLQQRFGNINKAAIALDRPPITIHNYVNGVNMPGAPFLIKLKEQGCDINWLLGGDENELPQEKLLKEIEALRKENEELKKEMRKDKKLVKAVRDMMSNYGKKMENQKLTKDDRIVISWLYAIVLVVLLIEVLL